MQKRDHTLRPVYTAEAISARVRDIAAEINAEYAGKPLVVVCILKGAFMFFSDLVKEMTVAPQIDFVRLASYGDGMQTTRNISFTKDVEISLEGKHVLLVEDVIDSGHTIDFLLRQMKARGAASLKVAVLIDKTERRETDVHADFVGFHLEDGFIIGYGLDCAEEYRELPAIYEIVCE